MLSTQLTSTLREIVSEVADMVAANVDEADLTGRIDYASIYSRTSEEFDQITEELKENGTVVIEKLSGSYYKLHEPLDTPAGIIKCCRVRRHDEKHIEKGYADFEVKNYSKFKSEYLHKPHFTLLEDSGEEMIELRDQLYPVRAYFLSGTID
jgi:hypothetical protein